jgi:hypothetical protein
MLPLSITAVIARNETWQDYSFTEPYECGWAREAIVYLRALKQPIKVEGVQAHIEYSPDGINWVDSGLVLQLPTQVDEIAWIPITHFGNWLRVSVKLPKDSSICVLVSLHLKG